MAPGIATTPIVEAVDLYRFYHAGDDETLALKGVSLCAYPNEILAISGPSGSGKSTLVACLAGLDEPDGGTVRIAGEQITRRTESERAALRSGSVGLLFQNGNLVDHLTVRQNIRFVQRLAGRTDPERLERVLRDVGLAARGDALPKELSGGEAARAGLAVALANDPRVVFADEPTGELDETTAAEIMRLLRRHADGGACVVLVTHNPHVSAIADREISLLDGMVAP